MKNLMKFSFLLGMIAVLLVSSCKKDKPDPTPATDSFGILKEYLVDNNMDVTNLLDAWVTTSTVVHDNIVDGNATNDFYVIDIRSAADFAAGHIPGAVNGTLPTILTAAANSGGKTILVACYTGQTAGHAVAALRLSGYPTAKILKWGMCSWNAATAATWPTKVGNVAVGNANWTAAPGNLAGDMEYAAPTFTTTSTDGAGILAERVQVMLTGGMNSITNADVLATPSNYFINNFWAAADVTTYGHISGAHRINPLTLAGGEYKKLNPNATVVSYCWTGQTSSILSAYLKVIGYDAKSILFGANGMIHDALQANKWTEAEIKNFDLESK
jgi:rhodanese-related sulfurtransferase